MNRSKMWDSARRGGSDSGRLSPAVGDSQGSLLLWRDVARFVETDCMTRRNRPVCAITTAHGIAYVPAVPNLAGAFAKARAKDLFAERGK